MMKPWWTMTANREYCSASSSAPMICPATQTAKSAAMLRNRRRSLGSRRNASNAKTTKAAITYLVSGSQK